MNDEAGKVLARGKVSTDPSALFEILQQHLALPHCVVTCMACDRQASVPSAALIAKLGSGFPVPDVAKRTRCQQCGGRADDSRPDWPPVRCTPDHSHLLSRG